MNNTQPIKREDLQYFYNKTCDDWKLKISELVMFQTGSVIEVPSDLITEAYEAADKDLRKKLKSHFKIQTNEDLFEVSSYEELCALRGIRVLTIEDFSASRSPAKALAIEKIKTIEEIYNGPWKADFDNRDQQKWYPYFIREKGSWRFYGSGVYPYRFSGAVGLYKDKKTADFVGKTFMDLYLQVI